MHKVFSCPEVHNSKFGWVSWGGFVYILLALEESSREMPHLSDSHRTPEFSGSKLYDCSMSSVSSRPGSGPSVVEMRELHWWEHHDPWSLSGQWPYQFLWMQGWFPFWEELGAYTRNLSTQQLCRPQDEGMDNKQFFFPPFSPGSVLIAEAVLWAAPFCHCFCRSSVMLRTPLSFGLSSAPCCSCINCRMAHLPSTTTGSCLGRIPLAVHAWPGDLWYFGWQTTCLCPAWYFPVKHALGCPFFRRHYPSSHSFQASLHMLLAGRSTPFCTECTSPLPVSSSLDSSLPAQKVSLGPAAGHICISSFASQRGLFKCMVQVHTDSINTVRRGPRYWAPFFSGSSYCSFLWISLPAVAWRWQDIGGVCELSLWEEHTYLYHTCISVLFWFY